MKLYHGSDVEIENIDLSYSQINKDFGKGFYLSDDINQAWNFAKYKADKPKSRTKEAVVTEFEFDDSHLYDGCNDCQHGSLQLWSIFKNL